MNKTKSSPLPLPLAKLNLTSGEIDNSSRWFPNKQKNLILLAGQRLELTPDGGGVQLKAFGAGVLFRLYPLTRLGEVDNGEAVCDVLREETALDLEQLLLKDTLLGANLRRLAETMKAFGFSKATRADLQSKKLLTTLLQWNLDLNFMSGDDYPLSALLYTLQNLARLNPEQEASLGYEALNEILDLESIPFGFEFIIDPSDLTLHLIEGGFGGVRAFYTEGVLAKLEQGPNLLEVYEPSPLALAT